MTLAPIRLAKAMPCSTALLGYLYHFDAMQGVSYVDINETPLVQGIAPPCKNTPVRGLPEVPGAVDATSPCAAFGSSREDAAARAIKDFEAGSRTGSGRFRLDINVCDIIYFIISSPGMMPQRLAADGSFAQTLGLCGTSRCHGRGSK